MKTDKADAFHFGELYYKENLEIYQRKTEKALNLRLLTRQHRALTESYVEIKLQFQVALDHVFQEYHSVFSDLYGKLSLSTLLHYPTALADEMQQFGVRRSQAWFLDKATQLREATNLNLLFHMYNDIYRPICCKIRYNRVNLRKLGKPIANPAFKSKPLGVDNVADRTLSFKVEEELNERVKDLIEMSGSTAKEWFTKAVSMAENQSVKEGATDYAADLSELEVHTTRIYELTSSMIQKSIYLREQAVNELETKLEQQREITAGFQTEISGIKEEKEQAQQALEESESKQIELEKQLRDLEETLETNKLLISEYKEKNDNLNGLVAKYQTYADENEQLRKTLNNERDSHKATVEELTAENTNKTAQITSLEQQIDQIKESHKTTLNNLGERKDLEHEKGLLKVERAAQKELAKANNDYTEKTKELYDNMDKQRETFEQKIAELEYQLSQREKNED